MIIVFCFLSFSSPKSFCASRQAPSSALSMMMALLCSNKVRYLQTIQDAQHRGVTGFSISSRFLHMDNVSRHLWVALSFVRYTTILSTQAIAQPCGVLVGSGCNYNLRLLKSFSYRNFHNLLLIVQYAVQISYQMFKYQKSKRAGRGRRGLDLEAKGQGAETVVFYFSRRSKAEGLGGVG
jgi:hypothetical protein